MNLSPIVLFVYNRPEHTRQTLEALAVNDLADQSVLYIYSDGPKLWVDEGEQQEVAKVRQVIRSYKWCKEVHIIESEYNRGLATSIVSGVTEVINRYGCIIVLEDDIVTKPGFLRYMNEALNMYADDDRVMHVSGMIFGTPTINSTSSTSFLKTLSCHGWATWDRAWSHYIHDIDELDKRLQQSGISKNDFDLDGSASFSRQLDSNRDGRINTWAVRWYASWLTAGGLSLFPHRSLVVNIGHESGTHFSPSFYQGETVDSILITRIPLEENHALRKEVARIWRIGMKENQKTDQPGLKESIRRLTRKTLLPVRKTGRRILRFLLPEMTYIDQNHPNCALKPNILRDTTVAKTARLNPPYQIREAWIGSYSYIAPHSMVSQTRIGNFCSIGPRLVCGWGIHPTDGLSTSPMFYSTRKQNGFSLCNIDKVVELKPVQIGNDVLIGMNVTILDGVIIGDGAIIGAGCVVSKNVPPYAVVAGNPMRILRYRFSDETIRKLQDIAWWNWPGEKLKEIEEYFFDVESFIARHSNMKTANPGNSPSI